mmetsp:Transcript_46339/g.131703  ORF Transcript_46339/g.131703 Transcript_46339/m.131703 type:complete len:205 (+) Transcript_46339:484-1098(+)
MCRLPWRVPRPAAPGAAAGRCPRTPQASGRCRGRLSNCQPPPPWLWRWHCCANWRRRSRRPQVRRPSRPACCPPHTTSRSRGSAVHAQLPTYSLPSCAPRTFGRSRGRGRRRTTSRARTSSSASSGTPRSSRRSARAAPRSRCARREPALQHRGRAPPPRHPRGRNLEGGPTRRRAGRAPRRPAPACPTMQRCARPPGRRRRAP